jgi:hypothetical protein
MVLYSAAADIYIAYKYYFIEEYIIKKIIFFKGYLPPKEFEYRFNKNKSHQLMLNLVKYVSSFRDSDQLLITDT